MCEHIICLPCLLERFDKGDPSTAYLQKCPVCEETIYFVPKPEETLSAYTAALRVKQGMPSPSLDPHNLNPFHKYTI